MVQIANTERVGRKQKKASKHRATHAGYAEREPSAPHISARLSTGRPHEALLFESRDRKTGLISTITALIDRRTGMLSFIAEATELGASEAEELRRLARHGFIHDGDAEESETQAPPLALVPLEVARLRLSRAILASRIGGQAVPEWLSARAELLGDPTDPASRIDDVFLCFACDNALPVAEQLALAARLGPKRSPTERPPVCPACRGESDAQTLEADLWLGRGWLMVAARLPRRALVCAAHAQANGAQKLRPERLDALRGAALLALGDPHAAAPHLTRAKAGGSHDERVNGWLSSIDLDSDDAATTSTRSQPQPHGDAAGQAA